jgi:hypothetical protein
LKSLNQFNAIKQIHGYDRRGLLEFIMRLHTGESIANATPNWSWSQRQKLGQRYLHDMAESLMIVRHTDPNFETYGDEDRKAVDAMQSQLEIDGYIYRDGVLLIPEESVLDENEEEGVLDTLVKVSQLADPVTLKHHLELSANHYREGKWDDSISNSRKVLEGVLSQIADRHSHMLGTSLAPDILNKPVAVRDYLENAGLLEKKEKEALAKVYGLLSDTGAHPYIAQRDQARLMRHLSLTFCQFVLLRLQGIIESGKKA